MHIIDQTGLILDTLEDLKWSIGVEVTMGWNDFNSQALTTKADTLLLNLEEIQDLSNTFLAQLKTYSGVIVFYHKNQLAQLHELLNHAHCVQGAYEIPLSSKDRSLLVNQLEWLKTILEEKKNLKRQMIKFSEDIDYLVKSAENEMLKAKRIHESVVPKRVEEFKGITMMSKYAVGSGSGSEYFDLIKGTHHSYLVVIHTNSYLASSSLMGLLNKYKGHTQGIDFELFMNEAEIEIKAINANKKKPVSVEMLLLTVNHLDLSCSGYSYGAFDLISRLKSVDLPRINEFKLSSKANAYFEFQLEREEKVIVFSPGFIFNWNEQAKSIPLIAFVNDRLDSESGDLLVELFFQLKKKLEDDFLSKDATAIVMEVKRYAIQKV